MGVSFKSNKSKHPGSEMGIIPMIPPGPIYIFKKSIAGHLLEKEKNDAGFFNSYCGWPQKIKVVRGCCSLTQDNPTVYIPF